MLKTHPTHPLKMPHMKNLAALAAERGLSPEARDTLVAYGSDFGYSWRTQEDAERAICEVLKVEADRLQAIQALRDYAAALPEPPPPPQRRRIHLLR